MEALDLDLIHVAAALGFGNFVEWLGVRGNWTFKECSVLGGESVVGCRSLWSPH